MSRNLQHHKNILQGYNEEIISSAYPDFLTCCDALEREVMICLKSPEVETYLNFIQKVRSEVQSIYYKEKIILLPRLIEDIGRQRVEDSYNTLLRLENQLQSLSREMTMFFQRMYYNRKFYIEDSAENILGNQIEIFLKSWELLVLKKERLRVEALKFMSIIQNGNGS